MPPIAATTATAGSHTDRFPDIARLTERQNRFIRSADTPISFNRYAFRQISRLINVGTLGDRRMISQQLNRNGIQNRRDERIDFGQDYRRRRTVGNF